ncbi:MAG TPA: long-chain-fatty-acid--CoA ligase [Actinomycetota bacterium]|nr:long-chain-fatty-acid--CoA ligase [Actinomycetota bacterium]
MNLASLAEENVERYGEYDAFSFQGRWHTNAEALAEANRFAGALRSLGVGPGQRVAVMLPNALEVFHAYGGTLAAGAVVVPVVFLLAPGEIRHILEDCRPKVLVTGPLFLDKVREAIEGLEDPPLLVVVGEPVPEGARPWSELVAARPPTFDIVERAEDDLAVIMYTGGTTGTPKGVELSHGNIHWNAVTLTDAIQLRPGIMSLVALPVAHLFGMIVAVVGQVLGGRGVLLEWFTPDATLQAIQDHRVEYLPLVPTMMTLLLHHPGADEYDTSSLRTVFASAAPVPIELAEAFEKKFDCEVLEGYGQTEAAPAIALMRPGLPKKAGSTGPPLPGVEVRIEDDGHAELPRGQVGEICARSPGVMRGYHNLPDVSRDALRHGWLHTGDMGYLDDDGYLFVTDRKKDLVIRGGFNVYPRDVEDVLLEHPGVAEAAVVGRPDRTMGEEVVAFVVRAPGAEPSEEELLAFAGERLAKYKRPKEIRFTPSLPKSPIGKVLKKELRASVAK